jgi:hypothetical protein
MICLQLIVKHKTITCSIALPNVQVSDTTEASYQHYSPQHYSPFVPHKNRRSKLLLFTVIHGKDFSLSCLTYGSHRKLLCALNNY